MRTGIEICEPLEVSMQVQERGHARLDWALIRRCTAEERRGLLPYIDRLHGFLRGLLAGEFTLRGLSERVEAGFERWGVLLLRLGWDYETIADLLYNALSASALSPPDYLKRALFVRFVLFEKLGSHDGDTLRALLLSYLGMDGILDTALPDWLDEDIRLAEQQERRGAWTS